MKHFYLDAQSPRKSFDHYWELCVGSCLSLIHIYKIISAKQQQLDAWMAQQ